MTSTATETTSSTAAVLTGLRATASEIHRAEVDKLHLTIEWAALNTVEPDDEYANHGFFGDQAIPVAGEGAPLVSEFAAMELAAALGMSTDAGKTYLGRALELAYRLPRLLARVQAGKLPIWRAFRIADHTIGLPMAGAAHVDRHLAPVAHSCSWAQLERLVEEAMVRFDPETAAAKRAEAVESRHFDIHTDQVSYDGTVRVDGELDLADALDLDDAISHRAKQLAALGNTESPRRPPLHRRRRARPPAALPTPPPRQDPLDLGLRRPRPGQLPVDHAQRHPVASRPPRNPPDLTTPLRTPASNRRPGLVVCLEVVSRLVAGAPRTSTTVGSALSLALPHLNHRRIGSRAGVPAPQRPCGRQAAKLCRSLE
jgi:hypothetical protein